MFQFQCGTIKSLTSSRSTRGTLSFNSNVVRLKAIQFLSGVRVATQFQFQCGTIKRLNISSPGGNVTEFQFQCGTIKRAKFDHYITFWNGSFNSNVVRLKDG